MIPKICSIIFGLLGLFYTYIGMVGAYKTSPITETPTMLVVQYLVFSAFVVPFLGAIGLGFGFILEGLIKLIRRTPDYQPKKRDIPG